MVSLVNYQNAITTRSSRFHDSFLLESRPKMLKDFLDDDCFHSHSSSSSNGFSMYPRKNVLSKSTVLTPSKSNQMSIVLLRSKSRKAATTTISAIHKVINVVKFFPFASSKSPLSFHKRFTHKFMSNNKKSYNKGMRDFSTKNAPEIKVKDILRWDSFKDLMPEKSTLVDFSSSPNRCTTTSTTITTTTTTTTSRRSSWCDSDFTSEDLPHICGESENFWGNKCLLGQHEIDATSTNPKGRWSIEEESEQQSPVSVLESTFHESEGYVSHFGLFFSNFRSTILEEEELNETVEHATLLLNDVKESTTINTKDMNPVIDYDVIMDYFIHELSRNEKLEDGVFEVEMSRTAKSWLNGQFDESYEWKLHDKREAYVKDMEKGVGWKVFKQEEEEISKALEINVFNELIDEILDDLFVV